MNENFTASEECLNSDVCPDGFDDDGEGWGPDEITEEVIRRYAEEHAGEIEEMRVMLEAQADQYFHYLHEHPEELLHLLPQVAPELPSSGIDLLMAHRFLTLLAEGEERFIFQTFSDRSDTKKTTADGKVFDPLAKVLFGTLEEHAAALNYLNSKGAGIFVTVNRDNGTCARKNENIVAVRALFNDHDAPDAIVRAHHDESLLEPHIVVESSPGKRHIYRIVDDLPVDQFKPWQQLISTMVGSDGAVCDLARVMRLPGFFHNKGGPFKVTIISESARVPYKLEDIRKAFSPPKAAPRLDCGPLKVPQVKDQIEAGDRHGFLTKLCAGLVKQGLGREAVINAALAADAKCCNPPKGDRGEIESIVDWASKNAKPLTTIHQKAPEESKQDDWPDLIPFSPDVGPAAPFPMTALGTIAGDLGKEMGRVIQAPDSLIGQTLLSAQSLVAQGIATLNHQGIAMPPSLFLMTLGESGERKSSCQAVAFKSVRDFEKEKLLEYRKDLDQYASAKDVYEIERKKILAHKTFGVFQKTQMISALQKPKRPRQPLFLVADPTSEGLVKQLIRDYPVPSLINDDAGQVLGGYSMNAENRIKTLSLWTRLYDGGAIDRLRAKDDDGDVSSNGKFYGRRLGMHLMLQEIVARTILSDPIAREQGFLARCLMVYPASKIGERPFVDNNLFGTIAHFDFAGMTGRALDVKLDISDEGEIDFRTVALSSEAARGWIGWHDHVESQLKPEGELGSVRAWGARVAENTKRVALTLAICEDPNCSEVKIEHLDRGIELMTFYAGEAVRIFKKFSTSAETEDALMLLKWLLQHGYGGQEVTVKMMQQKGPASIRTSADTVRRVCRTLVDRGYLKEIDKHTYAVRGGLDALV